MTAIWEKGGRLTTSFENFVGLFRKVFDHAPEGKEIRERLLAVKQGGRRAVEYALEFRTLVADSGWNIPTLKVAFHQELNAKILTELAC